MKQHGKKSASAAEIVQAMMRPGVIEGGFAREKINPPEGMPERAANIWRDIVKGEAAILFRTAATKTMLEQYCRHLATVEEMSQMIDEFDKTWLAEAKGMRRYEWLLKTRRVEGDAAIKLATKLRLTNQSRVHKDNASNNEEPEAPDDDSPWASEGKRRA